MDNPKESQKPLAGPVQSLAASDLAARRELHDATRLASQKKYRCRRCSKVDDLHKAVAVLFAGNVLLAVCPDCMGGDIILRRIDSQIQVEMPTLRGDRRIYSPSELSARDIQLPGPKVERTKLT